MTSVVGDSDLTSSEVVLSFETTRRVGSRRDLAVTIAVDGREYVCQETDYRRWPVVDQPGWTVPCPLVESFGEERWADARVSVGPAD